MFFIVQVVRIWYLVQVINLTDVKCIYHYRKNKAFAKIKWARYMHQLVGGELNQEVLFGSVFFLFHTVDGGHAHRSQKKSLLTAL